MAEADGWETTIEAAVGNGETWQDAQATLYEALGGQIKALWANGNGTAKAQAHKEAPPENYHQAHGTAFKRYETEGKSRYAHKGPDGKRGGEK